MVILEYLGHSGFVISDGSHKVVIDPFLTGNPLAVHKPENIECDWIVLTHGHGDHIGDTVQIAQANNATVHCMYELSEYLAEQDVEVSPGNTGGGIDLGFGRSTLVQAFHSSSFEGRYLGNPCGVILELGEVTIYHVGDSGLFGDMQLFGDIFRPDVALIPVGDRFTMGPKLATIAAELISPRIAIPIHYKTFPELLISDSSEFQPRGIEVHVMEAGDVFDVEPLTL